MQTNVTPSTDDRTQPSRQSVRKDPTADLLRRAAQCDDGTRHRLLDEVVLLNRPLAESLANRYRNRGMEHDDLIQVANVGLVNAAERFDPDLGRDFTSFAVPTITGEIKRYFRDHGWAVRPPRRLQELHARITAATAELAQAKGAAPTPNELADNLDVEIDQVIEALTARDGYATASIDYRGPGDDENPPIDTLREDEDGFERAETVAVLAPACRELEPRDRHILYLRFFKGCTQQEIADELGVTQMQVSRLLARILRRLRTTIGSMPAVQ